MRVALIIPAYNAADTLPETLASVAAQTRVPDEVIVGDDASTDDTVAVAEGWADRLPLRVVRRPTNGGPAAARNSAIAASTAELLCVIDADDLMRPEHVEALVRAWAATDDGLAVPNGTTWIPGSDPDDAWLAETAPIPSSGQLAWLLEEPRLRGGAALFSRARFDRVGGFREAFFGTEDWDLWIRLVRDGATLVRAPERTFIYRLRPDSVSSGDRLVEEKLKVLDAAAREGSAAEAGAIGRGRRALRAAQALNGAYALAGEGRSLAARRTALGALRGSRRVALRGAAMVVAPRSVARRREAVRFDPDVWRKRFGA